MMAYFGTNQQLSLQNICSSRGERDLFSGLDMTIRPSDLWQIEGANGSGKTTLLKIISGLLSPDEGLVLWNSKPIDESSFYQNSLYFGHQTGIKVELNALENLSFAKQLQNDNGRNSYQVLAQVSLGGFEYMPCFQLSEGQKRRVALARFFVSDCPLWILDEPFSALDKDGVLFFERCLNAHLKNNGMAVLTTHQPLQTLDAKYLDLSKYQS